jgi:hypothetical protein
MVYGCDVPDVHGTFMPCLCVRFLTPLYPHMSAGLVVFWPAIRRLSRALVIGGLSLRRRLMDRKQNVLIYRNIIRRYTGRQRSAATRLVDLRSACFAWYSIDQLRKNGMIVKR